MPIRLTADCEECVMVRLASLLLVGAVVCLHPPRVRSADPPPVDRVRTIEGISEYRLPNGLRVLLAPDPSKPLVTVNMTVLVGSRQEGYGEAGMAHLLEHMNIKSTPTHPDIQKALRDLGARHNASTWFDRTNYFETLPATPDNLEFAIRLEADRLVNSNIKREDLISEMSVVRSEFEMRENDPVNVLGERMAAAAFLWHNYGKTPIGNRADIERVPVESLRVFYKKHYRVDNAVLIVTGRFDEAKALEHVAKYFGPLKKPADKLGDTYTQEPAQDGERHVTLRRAGAVGAVGVAYHVPATSHPDFAALSVLEDCLTTEPAGRLYKALVEGKKAAGVGGTVQSYHDPALMRIIAQVEDPAGIDAARDTLIRTLESLSDRPITDEEVERAKRRFVRFYERTLANAESLADALSEYSACGDWRLMFLERDATAKVTAADVNRVARTYLTRNNRTVGVYQPTEKAERVAIPETTDLAKRLDGYTGRAAAAAGEAFDPTPENIEKRVTRGNLGPIKTAFLPKKTRGGEAHVRLVLHYGNEESLNGETIPADLLSDMLIAGTKRHTRQQLTDELNKLGAQVSIGGGPGGLVVTVRAKREHLAAALRLAGEMLREPAFPADEFATLKAQVLAGLVAQKAEPQTLAVNAVIRKLNPYPKGDIRYAMTIDEQIEALKAVDLDRVKAVYERQVGAAAGELAAVGNFDPEVVTAELTPILAGWEAKVPYRRIATRARPAEKGERIVIDTPDKANAVYFAATAFPLTDTDPDYAALRIGTIVLGGDPIVSRLGNRVRREKGLSYDVAAVFSAGSLDPAAGIEVSAITNPANMGKVEATVAEEVKKFLADEVTDEELAAAKKAFREAQKTAWTEDGSLVAGLTDGLYLGRTFFRQVEVAQKVEAVSPADVRKAFRRVLDPDKLVIAVAGDFGKVAAGKEVPKTQP
jgi:zinc protease